MDPESELNRHAVLDAFDEADGISPGVDELRALIAAEISRSGVSARTFRKHLAHDGVAARLHEYARREKALIHLLRHMVARDGDGDGDGKIVSFDELVGEGGSDSRR